MPKFGSLDKCPILHHPLKDKNIPRYIKKCRNESNLDSDDLLFIGLHKISDKI
jgi:hypothetical protein